MATLGAGRFCCLVCSIALCSLIEGISGQDQNGIEILADTGWQEKREYVYAVRGGATAAMPQYGGCAEQTLQLRATLKLRRRPGPFHSRDFEATVEHAMVAEKRQKMQASTRGEMEFRPLSLSSGGWLLSLTERGVATLSVNDSLPTEEVNLIKALASRLVLNTGGAKHLGPDPDIQFSVMEESVTGRCETSYAVATLDDVETVVRPQLAPLVQLSNREGRLVRVTKSRDYQRCERRPGEQRHGSFNALPAYISTEEVVIQGSLEDYLIHSSTISDQVIVGPTTFGDPEGLIETHLNITLLQVHEIGDESSRLGQLRKTDLVFENYDSSISTSHLLQSDDREGETAPTYPGFETEHSHKRHHGNNSNTASRQHFPNNGKENEYTGERENMNGKFQPLFNIPENLPLISPVVRTLPFFDKMNSSHNASLQMAPHVPLRPFFARTNQHHNLRNLVRKMVFHIASGLENPNKIPEVHTLSSFSILVELLGTCNYEQLMKLNEEFVSKKSLRNNHPESTFVWMVWRDAVAQTGSGPALLLVTAWVEDALASETTPDVAHLLAALPATAQRPDAAYVQHLLELVQALEARGAVDAHRAATLALAQLLRRWTPWRMRPRPGQRSFLDDVFMPYAARGLRRAAATDDAVATLTYARALAVSGSPRALLAFKPFLEGSTRATPALRMVAAMALEEAVRARPRVMRRVLTALCLNPREAADVRAAAAFALLRARPTAATMRRLARAASAPAAAKGFQAAVRSALEAAVASADPADAQLAADAQTALQILETDAESLHNSRTWSTSQRASPNEIFKTYVDVIGSEESLLPKALTLNFLHSFVTEEAQKVQVGLMTNSVDQLLGAVERALEEVSAASGFTSNGAPRTLRKGASSGSSFSVESIARSLGIHQDSQDPLVGSFFFQGFGESHMVPIERGLAQRIVHWLSAEGRMARSASGRAFRGVRLRTAGGASFYQASALGVATFVRAEVPSAMAMDGKLALGDSPRRAVEGHLNTRLLYSTKATLRLGCLLPFATFEDTGGSVFEVGVERNLQLHLPLLARFRAAAIAAAISFNLTVALPRGGEEERLLHYSVVPYAVRQSAALPTPALTTEADIVGTEKRTSLGAVGGIHLRAESTGETPRGAEMLRLLPLGPSLVAASGQRSSAGGHLRGASPARLNILLSPLRATRQPPAASVAFVWRSGTTATANASLRFTGGDQEEFSASAELHRSISAAVEKTRWRVILKRFPTAQQPHSQIWFSFNESWANVPLTCFEEVMRADHASNVTAELLYGKNLHTATRIAVQLRMWRSEERRSYLRRSALAGACAETSASGDRLQAACRNITMRAGYLDSYHLTAQVAPFLHNVTRRALDAARALGYSYLSASAPSPTFAAGHTSLGPSDTLSASVHFRSGGLQNAFVTVQMGGDGDESESVSWGPVPVAPLLRPLLVFHPRYSMWRRWGRRWLHAENAPTCVVDVNSVNTFANASFPLQRLGACWHVALLTLARDGGRRAEPAAVLVRDAPNSPHPRRDVKVVVGDLVLDLPSVGSSGDGVQRLPGGAQLLDVSRARLRLLLDGLRLVLVVGDALRGRVRGLCGAYPAHPFTALTSPRGCLIPPAAFSSAWNLPGEQGACPTAKPPPRSCIRPLTVPTSLERHDVNLVLDPVSDSNSESLSDSDYDSAADSDLEPILFAIPQYDSESKSVEEEDPAEAGTVAPTLLPWVGACSDTRVRLLRDGARYCFSLVPLPECSPHCSPTRLVRKVVPFLCVPYSKSTQQWSDRVMRGETLDLSTRGANRWITLSLPLQCV